VVPAPDYLAVPAPDYLVVAIARLVGCDCAVGRWHICEMDLSCTRSTVCIYVGYWVLDMVWIWFEHGLGRHRFGLVEFVEGVVLELEKTSLVKQI
jgi:hypothetical protein